MWSALVDQLLAGGTAQPIATPTTPTTPAATTDANVTGAASITSLDDAIARLKAYEAVGVDGLFVTGIMDRAEPPS